jgi:hypothetical protein
MATKIRMVSDWKTRKTGEVWSASDSQAKQLIDAEIAVAFVDELTSETMTVKAVETAQSEASATNLEPEVAAPSTPTEEVADAPTQPLSDLPQRYNRRCHTK